MTMLVDSRHIPDEDMAAYLDGGLDVAVRARVEAHLVTCDDCRAVLTDAAAALAALDAPPRRTRRPAWLVGGGLAAAAVLALLFVARLPAGLDVTSPVERNGGPALVEDVGRFAALSPAALAVIDPAELVLAWEPLPAGTVYRVIIAHERGDVVWSERTQQSSLGVPASAASSLEVGVTYYWRVEALLPDLRTASTPARSFSIRAP